MGLDITFREFGDVTILDLWGKSTISGGENELLSGHLQGLVAKGARKVLLNIRDLSQVDSSGVRGDEQSSDLRRDLASQTSCSQ